MLSWLQVGRGSCWLGPRDRAWTSAGQPCMESPREAARGWQEPQGRLLALQPCQGCGAGGCPGGHLPPGVMGRVRTSPGAEAGQRAGPIQPHGCAGHSVTITAQLLTPRAPAKAAQGCPAALLQHPWPSRAFWGPGGGEQGTAPGDGQGERGCVPAAGAGARQRQEGRQMQSRCLIISTAFSDPWKSPHPNGAVLLRHTLLPKAGAGAQHPPPGLPTSPVPFLTAGTGWLCWGWGRRNAPGELELGCREPLGAEGGSRGQGAAMGWVPVGQQGWHQHPAGSGQAPGAGWTRCEGCKLPSAHIHHLSQPVPAGPDNL